MKTTTCLKNVCDVQNGYAFDGAYFDDNDGLPLIRIRDINKGVCTLKYKGSFDTSYLVHKGDIIVGMDGEFNIAIWDGEKALLNQRVCRLVANPNMMDSNYLFYRIQQDLKRIEAETPMTTVKHLSSRQIEALEWELPNIGRQKIVASFLAKQLAEVEKARQAAEIQKQDLVALERAVYREAFQNVVPIAVPHALDEAPDRWAWKKLTDVARLESGHTPSRYHPEWWGGDVSWISLTEIRALDGTWVESTELRTNEAGIANSAARILPRGTVCFSRTASVGFVTIMATPMATSQDFANWVCGDELDPEYLMYALIRSRNELKALATGATHKTIYMPMLGAFHVCAPKLTEQKQIVRGLKDQLAQVGRLRESIKQQTSELSILPTRLLAQAFEESTNA